MSNAPLSGVRGSRVAFTVSKVSSQDPGHPCSELNEQTPDTRGWHSAKRCDYPQELQLRFDQRVQLAQLQLLSHEFKIATRVELYIMDPDSGMQHWHRLGHFSLNANEASRQQARELKSVQLSGSCSYMMLRMVDCHRNHLNTDLQVGVVALSVFGQPSADSGAHIARVPSRAGEGLDILAQDLNVDRDTARKIRDLTARKEAAVAAEDYDLAKQCKVEIQALQKVVSQVSQLERRKKAAVEAEDYDTAKLLKIEIDKIKNAPTVPDPVTNMPQHTIPQPAPVAPPLAQPYDNYSAEPEEPVLPPSPVVPSVDETRDTSRASVYTDTKWHGQVTDAEPAYETYAEASELPPSPSRPHPNEFQQPQELELDDPASPPVFGRTADGEVESWQTVDPAAPRPETRELNIGRGGASMYSPAGNGPPEQPPSEQEKDLPEPAPLSGPDVGKGEAMAVVYGDYIARCVLSKDRRLREHALGLVMEQLASVEPGNATDTLQSTTAVLASVLQDKMQTVVIKACPLLERCIAIAKAAQVPGSEAHRVLGPLAEVLVERTADSNKRVSESAQDGLGMMARFSPTRLAVCNALLKPLKNKKGWPQLALRLLTVAQVVPLVGVGDEHGQFGLDAVMELILSGFVSPNGACRDAALKATLEVAHEVGDNDLVVSYLKDDLKAQQLETLENNLPTNIVHSGKPAPPVAVSKPAVVKNKQSPAADLKPKSVLNSPRDEVERAAMNRSLGASLKRHSTIQQQMKHSPGGVKSPGVRSADGRPGAKTPDGEMGSEEEEFDDEDFPSDMCQFCGLQDPEFTEDTLDYHFWQDCPMLCSCSECGQVIEIMCLAEHLLSECDSRAQFTECQTCHEAIRVADKATHSCVAPAPNDSQQRCPLCHTNFSGGEEGWREHLLTPPGCACNPRALPQ